MPYLDDQGNPQSQPQNVTAGGQQGATDYGNDTFNYVANLIRQFWGREPTIQEVSQFGTGRMDDRYRQSVTDTIRNAQAARDYEARNQSLPSEGTTTNNPTTPATDWATKDYSDVANVKAYAASRGVTMSDQTAQYWADKYNSPDFAGDRAYYFQRLGQDPAFGGGGGGGMSDLIAPFTEQFKYDDFKAPTQADLLASPGFQSSLDRASNTLQRSAAAKGSLLSGSTAQALSDQTADLTTQGYGNLFNQDAATYSTNRGNAFDSYKERRANFYQNQDSAYAKLMGIASLQEQDTNAQRQLALGYAGLGSGAISGGAAQYNGLLTGGANAAASGVVGGANPYQSLYGGASQLPAWLIAMMRGYGGSSGSGGSGSTYGAGTSGGYYGP